MAMRGVVALVLLFSLPSCAGKTDSGSAQQDSNAKLDVALEASNLVFCFCRHGCGPGLDGYLKIAATNVGAKSIEVDVAGLSLSGPSTLQIDRGQGLLYNQPPFSLAPQQAKTVTLDLQPDTAADFPPGTYELAIGLDVAGKSTSKPLGSIAVPYVANNECGP